MQSKEVMELMVEACDDKRAAEIKVYDVKETSPVTDYFVICHGNSERQAQAISDEVRLVALKNDLDIKIEGQRQGKWILCDVGDVIVHIFLKTEREYYNLERLFKDSGDTFGG
ncbi:MAG: ribosome silencing factor [Jeotgalicoccus sp.]